MNLPPTLRKLARRGVTFSRALLKDGNLLSRPQPEAVLAPVSYRSSRRRRRRKRLLLKVPNYSYSFTQNFVNKIPVAASAKESVLAAYVSIGNEAKQLQNSQLNGMGNAKLVRRSVHFWCSFLCNFF